LARAEGFGLGSFDAATHGNPVVITGFGGQLDYLTGSPHLVRFELVPVHDPLGFASYTPKQRWAEPDVDHGAALLREVAQNPQLAREACAPLAADIRARFSPEVVAKAFHSAVERHRLGPARQANAGGRARRP
jgi:glycosyltransferase involved in cell wall biosynthesis